MVALRKEDVDNAGAPARTHIRAPAPVLALVRCDTLPEATDYRDTGCELAPSCLACPLARCKYDAPPPRRTIINARDREIALLRRKYRAPISALARTYGISRRQVFRILKAATAAQPAPAGEHAETGPPVSSRTQRPRPSRRQP